MDKKNIKLGKYYNVEWRGKFVVQPIKLGDNHAILCKVILASNVSTGIKVGDIEVFYGDEFIGEV